MCGCLPPARSVGQSQHVYIRRGLHSLGKLGCGTTRQYVPVIVQRVCPRHTFASMTQGQETVWKPQKYLVSAIEFDVHEPNTLYSCSADGTVIAMDLTTQATTATMLNLNPGQGYTVKTWRMGCSMAVVDSYHAILAGDSHGAVHTLDMYVCCPVLPTQL